MRLFIYLSEILGNPVFDRRGMRLGSLWDIAMNLNNDMYPRAKGIIVSQGIFKKKYAFVSLQDVDVIEERIQLKVNPKNILFQDEKIDADFLLRRDILDQQVVDTDHHKVVRVNDIHLLRVDNQVHLAHVDVGLRGIVRRLEWGWFIDTLVKLVNKDSDYLKHEALIPWKYTQALTLGQSNNVLCMDIARKKLSQIPPTELAEIMQDLDVFEKSDLFKSFDMQIRLKVFADLPPDDKKELIDQLDDKEAVAVIANIPADEATDLLMELPKERAHQLMRLMETSTSKKLRKLLGFEKDSAGGLMTTEYLSLPPEATVQDGLDLIKSKAQYPGNIFFVYIIDENNKYLGTTTMRRFINEDPSSNIIDTCYPSKVFVNTDDGMEEISLLLEQYKFSSIPVLNEEEILQGVITIDDVMEELISMTWTKYKDQL